MNFQIKIPNFIKIHVIPPMYQHSWFHREEFIWCPIGILCNNNPAFMAKAYCKPYEFSLKFADFMEKFMWYPIWMLSQICWFHGKIHMVPHMNFVSNLLILWKNSYGTPYDFFQNFQILWENLYGTPYEFCTEISDFMGKSYGTVGTPYEFSKFW